MTPTEDDKEAEKALRKIATKGGIGTTDVSFLATALFNAIMRSKRMVPTIDKQNEKRKSEIVHFDLWIENDKISKVDAFKTKIEETSKKMEEASKPKWSVLDEDMVEKAADIQNWDMEEGNEDDWDEEVDL